MNNTQYLVEEIDRVLSKVEKLLKIGSKFSKVIKHEYDDLCSIWQYEVNEPHRKNQNKLKIYKFFIPKKEGVLLNFEMKKNCYFIDIFEEKNLNMNYISKVDFYNYLLDFSGYINFINNDLEFKNIHDLYIKRNVKIDVDEESFNGLNNNSTKKIDYFLKLWAEKNYVKPILLLGERGIGKSWVAKRFCVQQLKRFQINPWLHPIAIYINLRVFSNQLYQQSSLFETIIFQIKKVYKITMLSDFYIWEAFIKTGKIILVLDGFDEMSQEIENISMKKHLWEVFNILEKTPKVVLTSRLGNFYSKLKMYKHFSYTRYQEILLEINSNKKRVDTLIKPRLQKNMNIWILENMGSDESKSLFNKYEMSKRKSLTKGITNLKSILKNEEPLKFKMLNLIETPAFYNKVVEHLSFNQSIPVVTLYRNCLLASVIGYNIETERAIKSIVIQQENGKYVEIDVGVEEKFKLLQDLAWYMYERKLDRFNINDLPIFYQNKFGFDYEILINDLKTQTLLKLEKNEVLGFLSVDIFSFLIASFLYNLFTNKKTISIGVTNFGSYNFEKRKHGSIVSLFLKEMLNSNEEIKTLFFCEIEKNIKINRPFTPWLKHIYTNLKLMFPREEINFSKNSWTENELSIRDYMVLIPSNLNQIELPFMISRTEVTNTEFLKFLNGKTDGLPNKRFWSRRNKNNKKNPHNQVINDYHLLLWVDNIPQKGTEKNPVVYISWFVAAYYCNWLSEQKGLPKYYEFILKNCGNDNETYRVKFNENSHGYRLPKSKEWEYTAREGNGDYIYPWDKYISDGEMDKQGIKFKNNLLKSQPSTTNVREDDANIFGVYGLLGNVREWTNDILYRKKADSIVNSETTCIIRGATWLLNEEGFKFKNFIGVLAQNTNLDVGFRIARSLSKKELKIVTKEYEDFNI